MTERLGLLTIGQSPREDIVPGFVHGLGRPVELVQEGALDGLTVDQVADLFPRPGEYLLITRMADGRSVTVGRESLLPRLAAAVGRLEERRVDLIVLLCTGTFPEIRTSVPLIEPDRVIPGLLEGLPSTKRLGVITPLPGQVEQTRQKWSRPWTVSVEAASPYGDVDQVEEAAHKLKGFAPDLVVLDCLGYTPQIGLRVRKILSRPVIVPQTIIGRVAAELLGM